MNRLFWLAAGMILGAAMYRYFREQGGEIPGFESLGHQGRQLQARAGEFADSGRKFAESGRELAEEGSRFAHAAVGTAQTRGREVVETAKAQAAKMQGVGTSQMRAAGQRRREDVKEHRPGDMGGA